jgi:hypothetical protein
MGRIQFTDKDRPKFIGADVLRRVLLVEAVGATCDGCKRELHIGECVFYRLDPPEVWCEDCGTTPKAYGR